MTGATGFVGAAVVDRCRRDPTAAVRIATRRERVTGPKDVEVVRVGEVGPETDWSAAVHDVDTVVHLAARVHVMRDRAADPLAQFRRVNVDGTANLARQAAAAGARRLVFISSIKVNGDSTPADRPYAADDAPAPGDPYGISKHEAEQQLIRIAAETGLDIAVIRPVLVYGPGVKANFRFLMRALKSGIPLPLGAIHNARSLVSRENLADLVFSCLSHPAAPGQVFLVSDGEDLSTPELLRRLGAALGHPARLIPVPEFVLRATARVLGTGAIAQRLCGSLQVDIQKTRALLGWTPPVSVDTALKRTAWHFLHGGA